MQGLTCTWSWSNLSSAPDAATLTFGWRPSTHVRRPAMTSSCAMWSSARFALSTCILMIMRLICRHEECESYLLSDSDDMDWCTAHDRPSDALLYDNLLEDFMCNSGSYNCPSPTPAKRLPSTLSMNANALADSMLPTLLLPCLPTQGSISEQGISARQIEHGTGLRQQQMLHADATSFEVTAHGMGCSCCHRPLRGKQIGQDYPCWKPTQCDSLPSNHLHLGD